MSVYSNKPPLHPNQISLEALKPLFPDIVLSAPQDSADAVAQEKKNIPGIVDKDHNKRLSAFGNKGDEFTRVMNSRDAGFDPNAAQPQTITTIVRDDDLKEDKDGDDVFVNLDVFLEKASGRSVQFVFDEARLFLAYSKVEDPHKLEGILELRSGDNRSYPLFRDKVRSRMESSKEYNDSIEVPYENADELFVDSKLTISAIDHYFNAIEAVKTSAQ